MKAGEDIQLKCSITERTPPRALIHMYLCKNGVGVRMERLDNQLDHVFLLSNVSVLDSGTYTCVYSLNKQSLRNVSPRGNSSVHVQVTGKQDHPMLSFIRTSNYDAMNSLKVKSCSARCELVSLPKQLQH